MSEAAVPSQARRERRADESGAFLPTLMSQPRLLNESPRCKALLRGLNALHSHHQVSSRSSTQGQGLVFPCDAHGHVPLDDLSERTRKN